MTIDHEEVLRNPRPGTAAAAAREFGIDLTLTIANLRLSPEERIRGLDSFRDSIRRLQAEAQRSKIHERR